MPAAPLRICNNLEQLFAQHIQVIMLHIIGIKFISDIQSFISLPIGQH